MSTDWFAPARYDRSKSDKGEYDVSLISKPKGVRLNSRFVKRLIADNVAYVLVGKDGDTLIVQPLTEGVEDQELRKKAFKVTTRNNSGQISSKGIFEWAEAHNLVGKRLSGVWNEEAKRFEFSLNLVAATPEA